MLGNNEAWEKWFSIDLLPCKYLTGCFVEAVGGQPGGYYLIDGINLIDWWLQKILLRMWHLKMDGIASLGFLYFSCIPPLSAMLHITNHAIEVQEHFPENKEKSVNVAG